VRTDTMFVKKDKKGIPRDKYGLEWQPICCKNGDCLCTRFEVYERESGFILKCIDCGEEMECD